MITLLISNHRNIGHIRYSGFLKMLNSVKWYSLINTTLCTLPFFGKDITQSTIVDVLVSHYQELSDENKNVILYYPETCLHYISQQELIKRLIAIHEKNKLNIYIYLVSNSEHILDGLRVNIVKRDILSNEVDIMFFNDISPTMIRIDSDGNMCIHPQTN